MLRCGLLGQTLGHSFSPLIHALLADYRYKLYPVEPDQLDAFMRGGEWDALNVTIPYKKEVVRYCTALSPTAQRLGSVNTLRRLPDGGLYGDNTDAFGFEQMLVQSGLTVQDKKVLVLGSGGASVTVCDVLRRFGAQVVVISRSGENNYRNLHLHADARLIVNTTPVGMYPHNGQTPLELAPFPQLEGVLDLIYNPAHTALLLQAQKRGLVAVNGLRMLVAQAKRSCEVFTDTVLPHERIDVIEKALRIQSQNIILVGMPGCGKSTVAALLGERLHRPVYEADQCIEQKAGMSIPEIFQKYGEDYFRDLETQVLEDLGKLSGAVISTGGGCVLREQNHPLLCQNGRIFWIRRPIARLARQGRPLSQNADLEQMYAVRAPLYQRFAQAVCDNETSPDATVEQIIRQLL